LYGRALVLRVVGDPIPCSRARRLVAGPCRTTRNWSCLAVPVPAPQLVWFRERERFDERYSTAIEARRVPCVSATIVERAAWRAASARWRGTPTRQQVLADDLRRLPSAARDAYAAVRHLLGAPAEPAGRPGHRSLDYDIGPERSFVVIHNEYLSVVFGRHDQPKGAWPL
jgi:hypothetical protein